MNSIFPIGLASGFASALLFLVVRNGSIFALLLDMLAPLPILIAALGWGPRSALIGTAVGTLTISALVATSAGLLFGFGIGLPSWLMGILLLSHRRQEGYILFLPIGISLLANCLVSALMALTAAVMIGGDPDGLVAAFRKVVEAIAQMQPTMVDGLGFSRDDLAKLLSQFAPAVFAAIGVLSNALLIWIAAKLVALSGRLVRPWPDLAMTSMPPSVIGLTVLSGILSLLFEGFGGLYARCILAALLAAYVLEGIGVILVLTRGMSWRNSFLAIFFLFLIGFGALTLPLMLILAALGITDRMAGLRHRAMQKLGAMNASPESTPHHNPPHEGDQPWK
jgi:hypothetical protein